MINLDRFSEGLPDSQQLPNEPVDECANDACQVDIHQGDKVWKFDGDLYCSGKCLAKAVGAVEMTIEKGEK
ncbi:hypothetical protein J31TS6_57340 [Brevibacillus reuszeri]|nr:hypothetical protein J31TS6_57340 [Brevibacillus reuszeri]